MASMSMPQKRGETSLQTKKMEEIITAYVFLAPAIVIFLIFLILPIFFALFVSITDWNGISPLTQRARGATGIVEFTNQTDDAVTIPAGTVINSIGDSPVSFVTTEEIIIEAGSGSTAEVPAQAVDNALC